MSRRASVQAAVLGLDAIEDGSARFAGGWLAAVLEVGAVNFAFLGEAEREALIASYAAFLNGLRSPVQIVVRVVPVSLEGYAAELDRHTEPGAPGPLADVARDHAAFLRRLARTRALLDRRCYVVVPLAIARPDRSWRAPFRRRLGSDALGGQARRRLDARCDEVAQQLARCGLPVRRLTSAELAELYYACWCPELARVQRLRRDLAGYASLAVEGHPALAPGPRAAEARAAPPPSFRSDAGLPADGPPAGGIARRFLAGARSIADLIAPAAVEERRDHLLVDGQYARTLVLTAYPRTVAPGWLGPLVDFDAPIELSLHVQPLDTGPMVATLTHKLVQLQSSRMRDARGGRLADPEREVAYEDAERLRDRLQRGDERVFSVALALLLRAPSLAELDDLTRRAQATAGAMLAQTRVAYLEQAPGFRACLPAGRDEFGIARNLDTSSAATAFPFASTTLAMARGALYGIARHNHAPVIVDPFAPELENANAVIFAKSGAGKSYFTKVTALRMLLWGWTCWSSTPRTSTGRSATRSAGRRYASRRRRPTASTRSICRCERWPSQTRRTRSRPKWRRSVACST